MRTDLSYDDRVNADFFWKTDKGEVERQNTGFEWLYRKTQTPKGLFRLGRAGTRFPGRTKR